MYVYMYMYIYISMHMYTCAFTCPVHVDVNNSRQWPRDNPPAYLLICMLCVRMCMLVCTCACICASHKTHSQPSLGLTVLREALRRLGVAVQAMARVSYKNTFLTFEHQEEVECDDDHIAQVCAFCSGYIPCTYQEQSN